MSVKPFKLLWGEDKSYDLKLIIVTLMEWAGTEAQYKRDESYNHIVSNSVLGMGATRIVEQAV